MSDHLYDAVDAWSAGIVVVCLITVIGVAAIVAISFWDLFVLFVALSLWLTVVPYLIGVFILWAHST